MGKEYINTAELSIAKFRSCHLSTEIQEWRRTTPIVLVESCDRQIWVARADTFANCPLQRLPSGTCEILRGQDAYHFLLRLIAGLDSKKTGEANIAGQVYDGWATFKERNGGQSPFDRLEQELRADTGLIRREIVEFIKPHRHEIAARTLSGQSKNERALIVGSLNKWSHASLFTEDLAKVIGNKRKGSVREIGTLAFDPAAGNILYADLVDMKKRGFLQAEICLVEREKLAEAFESYDRIYVDLPMGNDPEAEGEIISAWMNRSRKDNTLTCLRGCPAIKGASTAQWQEAALDNYFGPEDIRAEMCRIGRANKHFIELAENTARRFAEMRTQGVRPSVRDIQALRQSETGAATPPRILEPA